MEVAVFEPYASGHRLHFARLVLEAFVELGITPIWITTERSADSQQAQVHLTSCLPAIRVFPIELPASRSRILSTRNLLTALKFALSQLHPDRLLIPTASEFTLELLTSIKLRQYRANGMHVEALFLGPGFGYTFDSFARNIRNQLLLRLCKYLPVDTYYHLDPFQLHVLQQFHSRERCAPEFVVMPDPAPTPLILSRLEARTSLKIPTAGRYLLIAGAITREKGAVELLSAFRLALPKLQADDRILFAGKVGLEVNRLLQSDFRTLLASERIVMLDHYLAEEELQAAFSACNLVCAVQIDRKGSSGNVVRALRAQRAVLANIGGWAERMVKAFKLGWTANISHTKDFAATLVNALQGSEEFTALQSTNELAKFLTEANFKAHWTASARKHLQLPDDPDFFPWHDLQQILQIELEQSGI